MIMGNNLLMALPVKLDNVVTFRADVSGKRIQGRQFSRLADSVYVLFQFDTAIFKGITHGRGLLVISATSRAAAAVAVNGFFVPFTGMPPKGAADNGRRRRPAHVKPNVHWLIGFFPVKGDELITAYKLHFIPPFPYRVVPSFC
jgi:hypothetical protein